MRVGGRGDRHRLHGGVGEDPIEIGDGRAQIPGELTRRLGQRVADVLEAHARLAGEVASVDLADPAGADEGDVDHPGPPLV